MENTKTLDPLLADIEAYLAATGMSGAAFGEAALKDKGFMTTLRRGRELRRKTKDLVLRFINDNPTGISRADR